jgi:hypothetical protein
MPGGRFASSMPPIVDNATVVMMQQGWFSDSRTILLFTGTGITGVIAFLCQFLMYTSAVEAVRRKNFEMFW